MLRELDKQSLQAVVVEAGDVKDIDVQIKLPCNGKADAGFPSSRWSTYNK
jgi:hypothetical protein